MNNVTDQLILQQVFIHQVHLNLTATLRSLYKHKMLM